MALTGRKLASDIRTFLREQDEAGLSNPAIAERFQRLEKAAELQLKLNEQFNAQLGLIRPLLENIRNSLRALSIVAIAALIVSLGALVLAFIRLT